MTASKHVSADGFPYPVPFVQHLGARLVSCADGKAHIELELAPHHQNTVGAAHGGVVMTLLDVTMALAGGSLTHHADDGQMGLVTIEMKTSFMQPAQGNVTVHGRCIHRTRSLAFCEADASDAAGKLLARASGTFKYVRLGKAAT